MKIFIVLFCGTLALLLGAGCKTTTGPQFDARSATTNPPLASLAFTNLGAGDGVKPEWLQPAAQPFTLGPGDVLEVEILNEPNTHTVATVGADGKIYFHLLPGLDVWGLTLAQTRMLLEKELLQYFHEPPRVAITLRTVASKQFWIMGRLNTPGIYPLTAPTTLLEAVSLSGGLTASPGLDSLNNTAFVRPEVAEPQADLDHSFLVRNGKVMPVDFRRLLLGGDLSQNVYLQADDFIYVPPMISGRVYVIGAVAQPQIANISGRMTLVSAISHAGGTLKDAYVSQVTIVRGSLKSPQIAMVDYKAIVQGKQPDVQLAPHDIVYVPFSPYQIPVRYLDLALNTFARTLGANEGARAIDRNISVGVSVNVNGGGK
jgi:protein involved in polysaccharide export with SLBB domain